MAPVATMNPTPRTQRKLDCSELERSPINQKAMPRKSRPVKVVSRNMMMAERKEELMMPARRRVPLSICPSRRPRKYTAAIAPAAPRNAPNGVKRAASQTGRAR